MPDEPFTPTTGVFATDKMVRDWLRKPFKPEQIGKLPATQKRPALDFVGHAAVTDRLNKIAPDWSYTVDTMSELNGKVWIRGTMTIGGVSRPEFGDGDDPKEAIGNFIRRGAMRFGVAIDLWSREELEASPAAGPAPTDSRPDGVATKGEGGEQNSGASSGRTETVAGRAAPSSPAGDTSSAGGEAAGTGTGRVGSSSLSSPPGSTKYPVPQETCEHKYGSGAPAKVKVGGKEICRLCGMDWIAAVEGTTADLGAA